MHARPHTYSPSFSDVVRFVTSVDVAPFVDGDGLRSSTRNTLKILANAHGIVASLRQMKSPPVGTSGLEVRGADQDHALAIVGYWSHLLGRSLYAVDAERLAEDLTMEPGPTITRLRWMATAGEAVLYLESADRLVRPNGDRRMIRGCAALASALWSRSLPVAVGVRDPGPIHPAIRTALSRHVSAELPDDQTCRSIISRRLATDLAPGDWPRLKTFVALATEQCAGQPRGGVDRIAGSLAELVEAARRLPVALRPQPTTDLHRVAYPLRAAESPAPLPRAVRRTGAGPELPPPIPLAAAATAARQAPPPLPEYETEIISVGPAHVRPHLRSA